MSQDYRPNPAQSPWAAKTKPGKTTPITDAFKLGVAYYDRAVPDKYSEESDDRLMNSLIGSYAVEGNTDGTPNGKFFLT